MPRKSVKGLRRREKAVSGPRTATAVMNRINAQMKENVVTLATDDRYKLHRVPTGSLAIDRLTNGGFARGRHVELYGDWTSGKSLLVYTTLALAQERGEICALVDGEGIFNEQWFTEVGGDVANLILFRPKTANQLGNVLRLFLQNDDDVKGVDIVAIDSVASLLPQEELEHDFEEGDVRVASLARLMSLLLRRVTTSNDNTLFIWTNQWRDKISRIPGQRSTPGGKSLGFYASTRIEMLKTEKETEPKRAVKQGKWVESKTVLGQWVNCTLKKEKTGGRPESFVSLMLNYDTRRFDEARQIIDLGMTDEVIERVGDYFQIEGYKRVHGIKRLVNLINEDDELRDFLVACITEQTSLLAEGGNGS